MFAQPLSGLALGMGWQRMQRDALIRAAVHVKERRDGLGDNAS